MVNGITRGENGMDQTEIKVYFKIYADDFPLEQVTKRLDIYPTKIYKKGDFIRKINEMKNLTRSYTSWELSTGYQESLDTGELISQIIRQLQGKTTVINDLREEFGLECSFVIVIKINDGYSPSLHLDSHLVEFASKIEADFDIDLYANPY